MAQETAAVSSHSRRLASVANEVGMRHSSSSGLVSGSPSLAIAACPTRGGDGGGGRSSLQARRAAVLERWVPNRLQSLSRWPSPRQRKQRMGSRQDAARWSEERHLKHFPSVLRRKARSAGDVIAASARSWPRRGCDARFDGLWRCRASVVDPCCSLRHQCFTLASNHSASAELKARVVGEVGCRCSAARRGDGSSWRPRGAPSVRSRRDGSSAKARP